MTTQATTIREAAKTACQPIENERLVTRLLSGRSTRINQDDLPALRIQRGNEEIDGDQLGGANHVIELRFEWQGIADETADDQIDAVFERVLHAVLNDETLEELTTLIVPLGVEIEDGDAENPLVTATLSIQFNYERGYA